MKTFFKRIRQDETGSTMAEAVVGIAILAVVSTVAFQVVMSAQETSKNFTSSYDAHNQVTTAMATIVDNVKFSERILDAESDSLYIIDDTNAQVLFATYDPSDPSFVLADGLYGSTIVNSPEIDEPVLLRLRQPAGSTVTSVSILARSLTPSLAAGDTPLFEYYGVNNTELTPEGVEGRTSIIKKIDARLSLEVDGRNTPMAQSTSIAVID